METVSDPIISGPVILAIGILLGYGIFYLIKRFKK